MKNHRYQPWIVRLLALWAMAWLPAAMAQRVSLPSLAEPNVNAEDIQARRGDPSPSQRESKINNYLYQDEQINISPTDGVVRVLRTDQKVNINDFKVAVIPLRNAEAREIRNVLRTVTGMEGGRAEIIRDRTTGDNFVQVIAPDFMIQPLRDAVAALDVAWLAERNSGSNDVYYKLQNRGVGNGGSFSDPTDLVLADSIARFFAGDDGASTIDTRNNALRRLDEPYRNAEYTRALQMIDIPANQAMLEVTVYEIAGRNDTQLGLDYISWKNGPGRNLFSFATGGYNDVQSAKGWTGVFDPFLPDRIRAEDREIRHAFETLARESYVAANYLLPSNFMDFLNAKGKARVVNRQNVMVVSAQPAVIASTQQVLAFLGTGGVIDINPGQYDEFGANSSLSTPYANFVLRRRNDGVFYFDLNDNERWDGDEDEEIGEPLLPGLTPGRRTSNAALDDNGDSRRLHYRSAGSVGMRIDVVPYIGTESMELEIYADLSELNGLQGNGLPIINSRTVETTVRLLDGQPYVLAGLTRKTNVERSAKAPWLGSIPIVGYLFGGETNLDRETDLVIAITPHFYLSSQTRVAKPARVDTLEMMVNGQTPLGLPESPFGYDMYDWWPFNNMDGGMDGGM
jgi:type II secretory pathway component GspD/PulD (secretin)